MVLSVKKSDIIYSYADYLEWDDGERWEIINGVAYNMSPAPNRKHQKVSQALSREIGIYLKGKSCEIYSAPFDVRLSLGLGKTTETTGVRNHRGPKPPRNHRGQALRFAICHSILWNRIVLYLMRGKYDKEAESTL